MLFQLIYIQYTVYLYSTSIKLLHSLILIQKYFNDFPYAKKQYQWNYWYLDVALLHLNGKLLSFDVVDKYLGVGYYLEWNWKINSGRPDQL